MDRKTFLKSLVVLGVAVPCGRIAGAANDGACEDAKCMADAGAVRQFLSDFLRKEEKNLDRATLVKLMQQRGRACCKNLKFRQDLIAESGGSVDKLVELMGKIVGPTNCTRSGNTISLVYPVSKCVCGWSPERAPMPDDPYCECSAENNRTLFETVAQRPVTANVLTSPRRGGAHCTFEIKLA
ncbi:hypothetical protein [Occallatibacter savannae]|uniref:hypothetical protein n=1 Tax=Occallatibacter savannae TaxID=1002691 RepID=UPI000D690740|nr:hypothetical protein [Occallatibacter savannae]